MRLLSLENNLPHQALHLQVRDTLLLFGGNCYRGMALPKLTIRYVIYD